MNRKKILIGLSILLFLSLSSLVAWYFMIYRCNQVPSKYNVFSKYITSSSCQKTSISFQGILYNMRKENENLVFDFSAWNKETRETEEIKDLLIPYSEDIQKELENTKYIAPVEISLDIQKKYKYFVFPEKEGEEVWNLKKLVMDDEKVSTTMLSLLGILQNKDLEINGKTFEIPILSSFQLENGEIRNLTTIGYKDLASLYRAYIQIIAKQENFSLKEYMTLLDQYITNELDSSVTEEVEKHDGEQILLSEYTYFGACSLVKEITTQTKLSKEEKNILVSEYCNYDSLENILTNIKKVQFRYTIDDLIGNMNMENLITKERDTSQAEVINPYLASDLLSFADLTNYTKASESDIYNLASLLTANSLLNETDRDIQDYCELLYSEYLVEKNFNIKRNIPVNMLKILLDQNTEKMIKYMSNDIESGLLCMLPETTDERIAEFNNAILTKYVFVDVFAGQDRDNGIWDRDTFRITDNARLYELLLRQYNNAN